MEEVRRKDGRASHELRPIKIEAGVLTRADGSAYVEWGKNKILVAVYGPRELHPKHLQNPMRALVQCRYNMAPFSVTERKKPGPDRRSIEISKIISELFTGIIFTEEFPRTTIDIFIEVLQADAGTRCSGITGASVALADAGIAMLDLVPACAIGKLNGRLVVDLCKEEEEDGEADMPIAILPRTKEILLLQMDGNFTSQEFDNALKLGLEACMRIYELQKQALKNKYSGS
jgi:exosome complex component RRP41